MNRNLHQTTAREIKEMHVQESSKNYNVHESARIFRETQRTGPICPLPVIRMGSCQSE